MKTKVLFIIIISFIFLTFYPVINYAEEKFCGTMWIDKPDENMRYIIPDESQITVSGWAVSDDKEAKIKIILDGKIVEDNAQRQTRNDVSKIFANSYGGIEVTPQAGYKEVIDISNLEQGKHTIQIQQISRYGDIISNTIREIKIENKRCEGALWIDSPSENTSYTRPDDTKLTVSGWAVSDDKEAKIKIMVDGKIVEENAQRQTRNDVSKIFADSYGGIEATPQAGYKKVVDISNLTQGIHTIQIQQISRYGEIISNTTREIRVGNKRYEGALWIDSPSENTSYTRPDDTKLTVSGWAVSDDKEAKIKIVVDGKIIEENAQRQTRNDVSKIFADSYGGIEVTPQAGYKEVVDISNLEQGIHTIQIQQISRYGEIISNTTREIRVGNKKYYGEMVVDIPIYNQTYKNEEYIAISGWAVSNDENAFVEIYIDGKFLDYGSRYIREDVKAYNEKYENKTVNAGFGKMITANSLNSGNHKLTVYEKSRYGDIIGGIEVMFNTQKTIINNEFYNNMEDNNYKSPNNANYKKNEVGDKMIDVSQHQGSINWSSVANSGIKYAMIRVGYRGYGNGKLVEDPKFKTNVANAVNNGIRVGLYYYSPSINSNEAKADAEFIINLLNKYGYRNLITMPIAIDLEIADAPNPRDLNVSKNTRTDIANTFCSTIANYGYTPMIYAGKNFLETRMNYNQLHYDVWIAQYNSKCTFKGSYTIWQYTSKGNISGINGYVDYSILYKQY